MPFSVQYNIILGRLTLVVYIRFSNAGGACVAEATMDEKIRDTALKKIYKEEGWLHPTNSEGHVCLLIRLLIYSILQYALTRYQ